MMKIESLAVALVLSISLAVSIAETTTTSSSNRKAIFEDVLQGMTFRGSSKGLDQDGAVTTTFYCNSAMVGTPAETVAGSVSFQDGSFPDAVRSCEVVTTMTHGSVVVGDSACDLPTSLPVTFLIETDANVRLWVGDNLLVDAFDSDGSKRVLPAVVNMTLESQKLYTLRLEYADFNRTVHQEGRRGFLSLEWFEARGAPNAASVVSTHCLTDKLSPGEAERFQMQRSMSSSGWGTFDAKNMLSHVHLPEAFSLHGGLHNNGSGNSLDQVSVGALYNSNKVTPGPHAFDQSYTSIDRIVWDGFDVKVESALDDGGDLVVAATAYHDVLDGSEDVSFTVRGEMLFGRAGHIKVTPTDHHDQPQLEATFPGLNRTFTVFAAGGGEADPSNPDVVHLRFGPDKPVVAFSVNNPKKVSEIVSLLALRRRQLLSKFDEETDKDLRDAAQAMHTVLAWNTIYTPYEHGLVTPVSRAWDFGAGYVLFEWDNYFASLMLASGSREISYSNVIQMTKAITPEGCVPNFVSGTHISADRTEPPVGARTLLKIYRKFEEKWIVELLFDDLVAWNDWFWTHRQEGNFEVGLMSLGSDPIGEGTNNFGAARLESGLDNSPMYDDGTIAYDTETHRMKLFDVGMSSLYAAETYSVLELAEILGVADDRVSELKRRVNLATTSIRAQLYNQDVGIYTNKKSDTLEFMDRLSPTSFYPMLAKVPDDATVDKMMDILTSEDGFCVDSSKCPFGLPSISRSDSAFEDDDYWRGRTWGPHNYLVWDSLSQYRHVPSVNKALKELTTQSLNLLLKEWRDFGHVHENYATESGIGCNHGGSDPFYHWGALNGYIAIEEHSVEKGDFS